MSVRILIRIIYVSILEEMLYVPAFVSAVTPSYRLNVCCLCVKPLQSCPTLCYPMDYSPLGPSVHGILQARILEQVATTSSRGYLPDPGVELASHMSPVLAGGLCAVHRLNIEYVHPNFVCGVLTTTVMVLKKFVLLFYWLCLVFLAGSRLFLVVASGASSLVVARGILITVALLQSPSSQACPAFIPHSMWDLPRPGIKPTSPALEGGFSAAGLPGKSLEMRPLRSG